MEAEDYMFAEMADIHFFCCRASGIAHEARRLYQETFPNRRFPCSRTFSRIAQRLWERRTFIPIMEGRRPRTARTVQQEQRILAHVAANPGTSTRRISSAEGVHGSTVWRILHEDRLYPYHLQRVQGLKPEDLPRRVRFCQCCLGQCVRHPKFLWKLLFTDEAMFTRDGIFNFRNVHIWGHGNPHTIREARHQTTFSINVWAGIFGDRLIGPVRLPEWLTGPTYREFLERLTRDILPDVLDDVPLQLRVGMWFMHDGAAPHFSLIARQYLNDHFPGKWIGRNGPVAWPPSSPYLNPIDFYLWGHVKNEVYSTPVTNIDKLREHIVATFDAIRNRPGQLERVMESMMRRLNGCVAANGQHFENFV